MPPDHRQCHGPPRTLRFTRELQAVNAPGKMLGKVEYSSSAPAARNRRSNRDRRTRFDGWEWSERGLDDGKREVDEWFQLQAVRARATRCDGTRSATLGGRTVPLAPSGTSKLGGRPRKRRK